MDINGVEWMPVGDDHAPYSARVEGGIAIVKYVDLETGESGFQILVAEGTLNVMEKVGMASAIDAYYQIEIEDHIAGDD